MKLDSEHYDSVITLRVRPRVATVWVPKVSSDDERGQATELQGRISGLILMVRIFQVSKKPLGNSTLQRAIDSSLSAKNENGPERGLFHFCLGVTFEPSIKQRIMVKA